MSVPIYVPQSYTEAITQAVRHLKVGERSMSAEDEWSARVDRTTYLIGSVEVLKTIVVRLLSELPAEQLEGMTAWLRELADEITGTSFRERATAITVQEGYRGIADRAEAEVRRRRRHHG